MSAALQADKFGDVFHVLAEDELVAFRQHRHALRAKAEQLLSSRGVVQNIEGGKVYAFFRKKLFRSKAAASTGLGEQDEFVVCDCHRHVLAFDRLNCAEPINRNEWCQLSFHTKHAKDRRFGH